MRFLLIILALLALAWAGLTLLIGRTSIHELQAYLVLLIAAVLVGAAGVIDAVQQLRRDLARAAGPAAAPPAHDD